MTAPLVRWRHDGDVGRLTLARPQKRNALNGVMVDEACRALDELVGLGARVVVLDAEGPVFCSGADLVEARDDLAAPSFERLVGRLLDADVFVVAVVAGPALGAGVALAAVCPLVLCSSEAWFALPEHAIGLYPSLVLAYIEELVGPRHAVRLALTGSHLDPEDARACGLVDEIAAPDELDEALDRWIGVLRRDARVTADAGRGWRARFQTDAFTVRRRRLAEILSA